MAWWSGGMTAWRHDWCTIHGWRHARVSFFSSRVRGEWQTVRVPVWIKELANLNRHAPSHPKIFTKSDVLTYRASNNDSGDKHPNTTLATVEDNRGRIRGRKTKRRGKNMVPNYYYYYYYYYYYSHIFPDSRAQHCNYATLLAGSSTSYRVGTKR